MNNDSSHGIVGASAVGAAEPYGVKGAIGGAVAGLVLCLGLLWLTRSYLSLLLVPGVAAYGYILRPGLRAPGLKSRW
jgi:hypothetical protein